jgi:thiol-disulfide isomerase/thioredoxin
VWEKDWGAAFARAKKEQKPVFADFYATWCGPCRMMDEKVFPDPDIDRRLADYVLLRIDIDRSLFGKKYGVSRLPTYIVFDPWERVRFRIESAAPAPIFGKTLDMIQPYVAPIVTIGGDLAAGEKPTSYFQLASIYMQLHYWESAREMYKEGGKVARKTSDARLAQRAMIDEALTWALQGDAKRALSIVQPALNAPVTPENAVLGWLTVARARQALKDTVGFTEAKRRALEAATTPELRANTMAAVAGLEKPSGKP